LKQRPAADERGEKTLPKGSVVGDSGASLGGAWEKKKKGVCQAHCRGKGALVLKKRGWASRRLGLFQVGGLVGLKEGGGCKQEFPREKLGRPEMRGG